MLKHIVFDHDGTLVDTKSRPFLFEGILDLLTELQKKGLKLYIWTARDRNSTLKILKSLDIMGFFEDISTATDCESKPAITGLEYMLDSFSKDSILMIGDSSSDIIGAQKFGIKSIAACWEFQDEVQATYLLNYGAIKSCINVDECKSEILKLLK